MPDLRTLLDDASHRPPAADPVGAVHARVRRRAARRRSAVAACASTALVAAGLVWSARQDGATPPAASLSPTASPSATASASATTPQPGPEWRLIPTGGGTSRPMKHLDTFAAVKNYVLEHPEAFGHLEERTEDTAYTAILSITADDAAVWEARVRARAGDLPIRFERCAVTAATLDRVRAEVVDATWPSSVELGNEPYMMSDPGFGPCTMIVEVDGEATAADRAYARDRWGGVVGLVGSAVYMITGEPTP